MSQPASPPEQTGEPDADSQYPTPEQSPGSVVDDQVQLATPRRERVVLGLAAALVGLLVGAGVTLALWNFGFIASITSFIMAAGATFLYGVAAGAPPRRGVVPLILLVVTGVVATFFLLVGYDAALAYDDVTAGMPADQIGMGMGKGEFVRTSIFDGEVLKAYGKDMAFFFGFAVLGMWTTLKNVLGSAAD
ncbi:hypothetical protein [Nocardioides sp.]|uniref:hypothetical protein n=1 Tax=Nocardioides sp. TaxID=35761 RepID=UPI002BA4F999|nr:hypothetical protein [Nocardioides sp.]HXH78819.1 hypothetical protein [Nocardioides sp.]